MSRAATAHPGGTGGSVLLAAALVAVLTLIAGHARPRDAGGAGTDVTGPRTTTLRLDPA